MFLQAIINIILIFCYITHFIILSQPLKNHYKKLYILFTLLLFYLLTPLIVYYYMVYYYTTMSILILPFSYNDKYEQKIKHVSDTYEQYLQTINSIFKTISKKNKKQNQLSHNIC